MYTAAFEIKGFDLMPLSRRIWSLHFMLEAMAGINRQYLLENPSTPEFYSAGVRYVIKERPFKMDRWQDIPRTLELREGDCKDFAAWRVAELRNHGVPDVGFYIKPSSMQNPDTGIFDLQIFHILVRCGVMLEDPSANQGMPKNVPYHVLKQ